MVFGYLKGATGAHCSPKGTKTQMTQHCCLSSVFQLNLHFFSPPFALHPVIYISLCSLYVCRQVSSSVLSHLAPSAPFS